MRRGIKLFKGNKGFTIVELLVSMAIISIVAVFIVILAAEMLVFTGKTHAKDIALQLAESKVEELRSTLNIPEYFQDEPRTGYIRTVTSTYIKEGSTPTSPVIKYLRSVTVTVRTPTALGARTVTIQTNIQTYRPQISFILPVSAVAYANKKDPVLEGSIRDDAYDILKSKVVYRTGDGSSWIDWSPVQNFYTDINRTNPVTTDTLLMGVTYYFTIPLWLSGDGSITEVQVEATNTASITNVQPPNPLGGSSYVRLISDNTPPVISPANSPPVMPQSGFKISIGAQDPTSGGVSSGILNCYILLSKETSGNFTYWDESDPLNPTWTSTPYYSGMEMDTTTPTVYRWPPSGTTTYPSILPTSIYRMTVFALDQTIGKYYDYINKIPTQGVLAPAGETIWPDVAANFSTFTATLPYVETLFAAPLNPVKVYLYGRCNTYSPTYQVYFIVKKKETGETFYTTRISFSSTTPALFFQKVSLSPNTSYTFQAVCETPWGTFLGAPLDFTTPNQYTEPQIKVMVPNGGESWKIGSSYDIYWAIYGLSGSVQIDFSGNGGGNWQTIATVDGETEKFTWTPIGTPTNNCLIKVTSTSSPSIYDVSDSPFTIY